MSTITIIGGHGKVALLAAPLLVEAGHTVRSVIRKEGQAADVEATGAQAVVADVEKLDEQGTAEVLAGSDAVVWSAGVGGGDDERTWALDRDAAIRTMDATRAAGIRRFIMVSFYGSRLVDGKFPGVEEGEGMYAYFNAKAQADDYLRIKSGLDWTVLGPTELTLEEPTGKITVAQLDESSAQPPATSRANVARVVAAAVDNPASTGCTVNFYDGDTPIAKALEQGVDYVG